MKKTIKGALICSDTSQRPRLWAWRCTLLWLLAALPGLVRAQPDLAPKARRLPAGQAIFLRAVASPASAYVGQALSVRYLLYYRVPVIDPDDEIALKFGNCYAEEYPLVSEQRTETIGGQVYQVRLLKRYLVVPQLAGPLEIPVLAQRYRSSGPPDAEDFFGEQKTVSTTVRSAAVRVPVRALPPPLGLVPFCNAVGPLRFQTTYTVARKAGNLLTVRLKVTGPAHLKNLKLPLPQLPAGVEAFNVRSHERHTLTAQGLLAEGIYTYEVVANYRGTYALPGIALQYFDPSTGRYVAYAAPAYQWRVATGSPPPVAAQPAARRPAATLYIKPDLWGSQTGRLFFGSRAYYGLLSMGLVLFLVSLAYAQQLRARTADPRRYQFRKAKRWALRAINHQEQASWPEPDQLCKGLHDILVGYLGHKLGLEGRTLLGSELPAALQAHGVPAPLQARTLEFMARLTRQRFAPGQPAAVSASSCSQELAVLINQLDIACCYA